jgi:acetolactate synthase-1/2/3 large subunit
MAWLHARPHPDRLRAAARTHGKRIVLWFRPLAVACDCRPAPGMGSLFAVPERHRQCNIAPQRLMQELGSLFPPTTRFLADTGNSESWAIHCLNPGDRRVSERPTDGEDESLRCRRQSHGGWLRVTMNFAPMGWAIGGAIGTAAGNPDDPVVCITGDGMLMNGSLPSSPRT